MRSEKPKSKPKSVEVVQLTAKQSAGEATAMYGAARSITSYFVNMPKKNMPKSGP